MATKKREKQMRAIRDRRDRKHREIPRASLEQINTRDRIAEAVHRSVCEFTGTDGFGLCMMYSVAGMGILKRVLGKEFYPQGGTLAVLADPPDRWMIMDAENFIPGFGGEFHSWLAAPSKNRGFDIIDFSARHYKRYCAGMIDMTDCEAIAPGIHVRHSTPDESHETITWNREDPPSYVWLNIDEQPEWLILRPIHEVTEAMRAEMAERQTDFHSLIDLAVGHFVRSQACLNGKTLSTSLA